MIEGIKEIATWEDRLRPRTELEELLSAIETGKPVFYLRAPWSPEQLAAMASVLRWALRDVDALLPVDVPPPTRDT